MDEIYTEMIDRNKKLILSSGFSPDEKLKNEIDDRRCLAVFCHHPSFHFSTDFYEIINSLPSEMGVKYCTPEKEGCGILHWSFLQILKFGSDEIKGLSDEIFSKYFEILQNIFNGVKPFEIEYTRVITTPNGILISGECSIDVNYLRDNFREEVKKSNLPLIEPYYTNIYHTTIFRFTESPPENFYLEKNLFLGRATIGSISLGLATWRMLSDEISDTKTIILK